MNSPKVFVCDFETTVYEGQDYTEVWAAACVEIGTEEVHIFHSISEQYEFFRSQNTNVVAYYHNLKFDGSFWLDFLLIQKKYEQALWHNSANELDVTWRENKDMDNNTFKYNVSDRGQWYSIIVRTRKHFIEIRDSLKLLPFSVERIGKSFGTKHKKLDMEYKGLRYAGCTISEEERRYIENDVLVVKEALEIMFNEGHKKLTIGACCLSEYKNICKKSVLNQLTYEEMFPDVYSIDISSEAHRYKTAGEWIRRTYRGGWCYLVKGKENKIFTKGTTADVNSLYPSVMSSESKNKYPVGAPHFWVGEIPECALHSNRYYFVHIRTRFYLKPGKLPFIQIKTSFLYKGTESLETSDVQDPDTGEYYTHYRDSNGTLVSTAVDLYLTMTDYQLIKDHYDLVDLEVIDGCWFYSQVGIFDEYINKYRKLKTESTGARRELAKLFLNNLYGKMAASTDSSFKLAYVKEDGVLGFIPIADDSKRPGYIPVGSAITSYAREFTIRAAQSNYHGKDKPGFIYADTDSIHCDLAPDDITGIRVDDKEFCCWKLESCWDEAIFTRQKTYIEHVTHENLKEVEPYYNIKCAGMPNKCKDLFELSITGKAEEEGKTNREGEKEPWSDEEKVFLFNEHGVITRGIDDFKIGLKIPGKLMPRRIKGGIVLVETTYEMR